MKARGWRVRSGVAGTFAAFMLACLLSPVAARALLDGFSRPAMILLHRLTAPFPFPLMELLVPGIGAALTATLVPIVISRSAARLKRWTANLVRTALALAGALALLWTPAWAQPVSEIPAPDDAQLAWLCDSLIDALNASPLDFPAAKHSLAVAGEVAGMPGCAVKAARYPEWMRAARICGLFVPLTGEAVVDADAAPSLIPFTAVHELMHLSGIADEGAANIAAWQRCMAAGGRFADSARLWALRYALGMLRQRDEAAWRQALGNMKDALARVFDEAGGEAVPSDAPVPAARALSPCRGDYTALIGRLAEGGIS